MDMKPITPVEVLVEEFMVPMNIGNKKLMELCEYDNSYISNVLFNNEAITVEFSNVLSHVFGTSKEFWIDLQHNYDKRIKAA
jgi:addiction module HigA family antidote